MTQHQSTSDKLGGANATPNRDVHRFDRAVGPGADVDGAFGGGFQTLGAMGTHEPDDAKAGAKALFGMWARLRRGRHRTRR